MNFNSLEYKKFYDAVYNRYKYNPSFLQQDIDNSESEYLYILTELARTGTPCPVDIGIPTSKQLLNVKENLDKRFYDIREINKAKCKFSAIFHPVVLPDQGSATKNEIIRESLTGLTRIGDESAMGYAILGGIGSVDNLFVLKTSRKGDGRDLYTERFVTEFGTNKLRRMGVPNFAVTYGGFVCSRPIIDLRTKTVIEYCSPNDPDKVPYVVYEYVSDAISGFKYIQGATEGQILSMYLQVLLSISIANKVSGFTHQDLHPGNVMMKKVGNEVFQIPYTLPNGNTVYIRADRLAVIIDFGLSTIVKDGKVHGCTEPYAEYSGRYRDVSWPLHDAYKLLMFMARELLNKPALKKVKEIYKFFSTEPIEIAVEEQFELRYSLPYDPKFTIGMLIKHVIDKCGGSAVITKDKDPKLMTLECHECDKVSLTSAKRNIDIPTSFNEFYDFYPYISRKYPQFSQAVKDKFNYSASKDDYMRKLNAMLSEVESFSVNNYLSDDSYYKLFRLINVTESLVTYATVGNWIATYFSDTELLAVTTSLTTKIAALKVTICSEVQKALATGTRADGKEKLLMLGDEICKAGKLKPVKFSVSANSKSDTSAQMRDRRKKILQKYGVNK